jgi:predicted peroxiredoxin
MSGKKKLVVINSRGFDDERASVAWVIANTGIASDMDVTMFLVSAGADWARKGAAGVSRLNPLDPPIGDMLSNFIEGGGNVWVCPPCAKVRGYDEDSLVDGAILAGAPAMLAELQAGASSVTF